MSSDIVLQVFTLPEYQIIFKISWALNESKSPLTIAFGSTDKNFMSSNPLLMDSIFSISSYPKVLNAQVASLFGDLSRSVYNGS